METLSEKIKGIIGGVAVEVNDLNKEFVTEKITAAVKKEQMNCSINVAQYRAVNIVKNSLNEILRTLKSERINPATYERIKNLFDECV